MWCTEAGLHSTSVVGRADTGVVVDSIHAGGVILAVIVFTIIRVHLTLLALETRQTHTAGAGQKHRYAAVISDGIVLEKHRIYAFNHVNSPLYFFKP